MSVESNKKIIIRWCEATIKGNFDIIDEVFAPNTVHLGTDGAILRGRAAFKEMYMGRYADNRELREAPLYDVIAEGDKVVLRRGTEAVEWAVIVTLKDGQIIETRPFTAKRPGSRTSS